MPTIRLTCPGCGTKFLVQADPGQLQAECPTCHKSLKFKLSKPAADSGAATNEPAPLAREEDEYRLADAPIAPLDDAPIDDLALDLGEPVTPLTSQTPASKPGPHSPIEKKPAKEESGGESKRWIILGAAGAVVLIGLGVAAWMFFGDDRQTDATAANGGASASIAGDAGTQAPASDGGKSIEWFQGEFTSLDRAPAGVRPNEISHESFLPAAAAVATGPGGSLEAPAPWKAPSAREVAAPEIKTLRHYPVAWNDTHYIVMGLEGLPFTIAEHPGHSLIQLWWQRFDAKTNRPVGPRFTASERIGVHRENPTFPLAALSADGEWFAHVDPELQGRIAVWTKDGVTAASIAVGDASPRIDWLSWDAKGHLLTLAGGSLTAWLLPGAQPAWNLKKDANAVVRLSPARDWLAIGNGGVVALVDLEGQLLGQLQYLAGAVVSDLAIASDQQRLAAIYDIAKSADRSRHLVVWDLESGKARHLNISHVGLRDPAASPENANDPPRPVRRLFWAGDEQLGVQDATGGLMAHFFQLRGWAWLATFSSFQKSDMLDDPTPVFWGPGDRPWAGWGGERGSSYPVTLLGEKIPEHQEVLALMTDSRKELQQTFRLEVDAGSPAVSQRRGEEIARFLIGKGVVIGPGGDTLRIRYGVADSGEKLDLDEAGKHKVPIPKLMAHYQWLDPQGKEVWSEIANGGFWSPMQTKYLVGQPELTYDGEVRRFNFRGDLREAIVQEILDDDRFSAPAPESLLRRLQTPAVKAETTLPLRLKAAFPSMDELNARPELVKEIAREARSGLAAELSLPPQDNQPVQLHYSADGGLLTVTVITAQSHCLLRFDRASRKWLKPTPLTPRGVEPALASTLDRFAYHDQGVTFAGDANDPSRQLALPQKLGSGLTVSQLQLAAGARRLSRVVSLESNPNYPRRIEVWNVAERRLAMKHVSETGAIATAFSPDGALFAAGDRVIRVWDTNTLAPVGRVPVAATIEIPLAQERVSRDAELAGVLFSRDGKTLAALTAHRASNANLAASAMELRRLGPGQPGSVAFGEPRSHLWRNHKIISASLDQKGDRVAILSATNDWRANYVELYSFEKDVTLRRWNAGDVASPSAVALSPAGDELAIAAGDKVLIFDVATPLEVAVASSAAPVAVPAPADVTNLAPPQPPATSQAATNTAPAYDKIDGFLAEMPLPDDAGPVQDLSFSDNGNTLAVAVKDRRFLVYDPDRQKLAYEIAYQPPADLREDPFVVSKWVISPDHDRAAFVRNDGILCLFDRRPRGTPTLLNKRPVGERDYHDLPAAAFSPDGRLLCFCQTTSAPTRPARTPLLEAWDLRQGKRVHEVEGFAGPIAHFAFAADGSLAACVDSGVHLLDPKKGFARIGTFQVPEQRESLDPKRTSLALSAKGNAMALAMPLSTPGAQWTSYAVQLWSHSDGLKKLPAGEAPRPALQPGAIKAITLDPAGARLFAVCDDELMKERWLAVTDVSSGERLAELGPLGYGIDLSGESGRTGEQDLSSARLAIDSAGKRLAIATGKKLLFFDLKSLLGE